MLADTVDAAGGSEAANEQFRHNEGSLNAMASFAEDIATCRRVLLMRHFGENFDAAACQGASQSSLCWARWTAHANM
jgi:superfamily II DNA helicase RecQ